MVTIQGLRAEKKALIRQAEDLLDIAKREHRYFYPSEEQIFDQLFVRIKRIDSDILRRERLEDAERCVKRTVIECKLKRQKAIEKAYEILDRADRKKRGLTPQEQRQFSDYIELVNLYAKGISLGRGS